MKKLYLARHKVATVACAIALTGVTLIWGGCMDEPSPVGSALLPPGDYLQVDSARLSAQSTWSGSAYVPSVYSSYMMLGRSDGLEAWAGIRFISLPETLASATILSAQLRLRARYYWGNPAAAFSFRIRRVLAEFSTDSLTLDSVRAAGFTEPTASPEATFGALVDTAEISATLDTALVNRWFRATKDAPEYGMILEPTNSGVIRGFSRFSAADTLGPALEVIYRMTDTSAVDTVSLVLGLDRWVAALGDTSFAGSTQRMYVRNGVAFRGIVGFDVSSLPLHAAIHKAELTVALDQAQSEFNKFTVDSLKAVFITQSGYQDLVYELNSPPTVENGEKTYRFTVTLMVQAWVRGAPVHQLALAGLSEMGAFDQFVLYGAGVADSTLRPSLQVYYSVAQ